MSNQIEQIRAQIEGRFWGAGQPIYGEEATEQARQLLDFIDQLLAQTVPADVQEAAKAYSASVSNGHHFRDLETGYAAGMLAERERLMKDAVEIDTDITINRYTKRHILNISSTDEHIQHLPKGEYKAIIIKKEK